MNSLRQLSPYRKATIFASIAIAFFVACVVLITTKFGLVLGIVGMPFWMLAGVSCPHCRKSSLQGRVNGFKNFSSINRGWPERVCSNCGARLDEITKS